ncbi:isoprenoid synthase domain-containing protein [Mycena galericulata]|nr:isoprenoid synthase domain-containing protein [Mycena galericulata]
MEFRYSEKLDPASYETYGLTDNVPLRMHKDSPKEIESARRVHSDWSSHVRPLSGYMGGQGPYGYVSVTVPECLPDRFEVVAYSNEYMWLYDDYIVEEYSGDPGNLDEMSERVLDEAVNSNHRCTRPEEHLLAQLLREMMDIDRPRAITSLQAWASYAQLSVRKRSVRTAPFETLDEYVPTRITDCGELVFFGILTFGLGLTIPEEEYHLCLELGGPGYAVWGLTNDLYSWEKEYAAAVRAGKEESCIFFNAMAVIMKERSVNEAEAKTALIVEIKRLFAQFCQIVEESKNNPSLSKDLKTYLEAVMYACSGNSVWHIYSPRYRTK